MYNSIKRFFSRNRRKFIIAGVAIGGTYFAASYAKQKLIEWQESNAREFIEKTRRVQHFESTERTCNQAIVSLTTNVCDEILNILNIDTILEKLHTSSAENKIELWENLKIIAFTRLTTLIYATTILVITLRVQVNILGGYLYKDTKAPESKKISDELRQSYLSLVQSFLHNGLRDMTKLIESKVRIVLETYPLTKELSLSDIEQIFWSIQMAINSDPMEPNSRLARYVLPPKIDNDNEMLQQMYNETLDVLESDEVTVLSANSVSRGFSVAVDNIAEYFTDVAKPEADQDHTQIGKNALEANTFPVLNINNIRLRLAKIIPILNGITSRRYEVNGGRLSLVSSLISLFLTAEKMKVLGANVYEGFSG